MPSSRLYYVVNLGFYSSSEQGFQMELLQFIMVVFKIHPLQWWTWTPQVWKTAFNAYHIAYFIQLISIWYSEILSMDSVSTQIFLSL